MHYLRRQRQKTVALILLSICAALLLLACLSLAVENSALREQIAASPSPSLSSEPSVSPSPDLSTAPAASPAVSPSFTPTADPSLSGYQALFPDMVAETLDPVDRGEEKIAYLTFDDGPSSLTPQYLSILEQYHAKATFFVVPKGTEESDNLLREIIKAGHAIGIHAKSHDYKKIYASVEAFLTDFHEAYQEVVDATGYRPTVFRFPGGSVNSYNKDVRAEIIAEMTRRGFVYFDWNVSTQDASNSVTEEEILHGVSDYALSYHHPQVLMHDSAPQQKTLNTLPKILDFFQENGYSFQPLDTSVIPVHF